MERLHGRLFPLRNERAGRGRRPRSAPRRHAPFPGSATFSDRELRPFVNGAKTAKTRMLRRERCSLLPRPSVGESDGEMAHAGARSGRGPRRHFGVIAVAGAAGACPRGEQASPRPGHGENTGPRVPRPSFSRHDPEEPSRRASAETKSVSGSRDGWRDRSPEVLHFGVSWPELYRMNGRKHAGNETRFPEVNMQPRDPRRSDRAGRTAAFPASGRRADPMDHHCGLQRRQEHFIRTVFLEQ